MTFDAFGDLKAVTAMRFVEGDMVAERAEVSAVHKGDFMGVPATGKQIHWTENHIYRIADGRIAEAWSEVSVHDPAQASPRLIAHLARPVSTNLN